MTPVAVKFSGVATEDIKKGEVCIMEMDPKDGNFYVRAEGGTEMSDENKSGDAVLLRCMKTDCEAIADFDITIGFENFSMCTEHLPIVLDRLGSGETALISKSKVVTL